MPAWFNAILAFPKNSLARKGEEMEVNATRSRGVSSVKQNQQTPEPIHVQRLFTFDFSLRQSSTRLPKCRCAAPVL